MNQIKKQYQYWWRNGDGYSMGEFENTKRLLELKRNVPNDRLVRN